MYANGSSSVSPRQVMMMEVTFAEASLCAVALFYYYEGRETNIFSHHHVCHSHIGDSEAGLLRRWWQGEAQEHLLWWWREAVPIIICNLLWSIPRSNMCAIRQCGVENIETDNLTIIWSNTLWVVQLLEVKRGIFLPAALLLLFLAVIMTSETGGINIKIWNINISAFWLPEHYEGNGKEE